MYIIMYISIEIWKESFSAKYNQDSFFIVFDRCKNFFNCFAIIASLFLKKFMIGKRNDITMAKQIKKLLNLSKTVKNQSWLYLAESFPLKFGLR